MNILIKKIFLFFIFLLLANPNSSYAKLIEFEKCYRIDYILNEKGDDVEDLKNIKWIEDYYNFKNTRLYIQFENENLDKKVKINGREKKVIDNHSQNFYDWSINKKYLKDGNKIIKEYQAQGYKKINIDEKNVYSISTKNEIITHTRIFTDANLDANREQKKFYFEIKRRSNQKSYDYKLPEKIITEKYKIDSYSGGIIQAKQIQSQKDARSFYPGKLAINLQNNTLMYSLPKLIPTHTVPIEDEFITNICKSLSGSGKNDDYTKYWWAVILIAAVIFFIYTQTGRELKIRK